MIVSRALFNTSPPSPRTRISNHPTLLYSWWCTIASIVIIALRLFGRYFRNERLFREDQIMAWSMLPLLARMGCVHVVLLYGTNNVDLSNLTDPVKIRRREIGSQLVLAARIFYALFIWMAKFTVSEFLKRLTERFWRKGYERGLQAIRIFLLVTFVVVFIATLAECHPTAHYWQVIPDPGPQCRQGYPQLLTMGIADVITDILLIAFPIPIIIRSGMPLKRKLPLVALFSLSLILIAITGARVPLVIKRHGIQQFRTVFASSEILAAAIVSNAIVLGSFLRDRGIKKTRFRPASTSNSMERRDPARRFTEHACSSDENLARSLGYRTKPELLEKTVTFPRSAPVADFHRLSPTQHAVSYTHNQGTRFPGPAVDTIPAAGDKADDLTDTVPSSRGGRRVSWFDVGGLLENSAIGPSPKDSVITHDFAAQPRRSSRASTMVVSPHRPLSRSATHSSQPSQQSIDWESITRSPRHEASSPPQGPPSAYPTASAQSGLQQDPDTARSRRSTDDTIPPLQDLGHLLSSSPSSQ